ncbi:MAG: bile acid:sodium symporter family protein, partial [Megasphaera elsdenii]|nr:bile acid:sodium symporter family protein [Megasphaera elsdenii]
MKKVCALIGKYFGVLAVIFLIIGMTLPTSFSWVLGKVGGVSVLSVLLGIIMFGMGMTMSVHDFALVLKRPKDVFFGACAQYLVMPFLAYVLSTLFHLNPALTVGVVLVGTCPGGTSSNVITFMSKGDVPLSVTMTSVSTLISPIMTPLLTYLIIGQRISFDPVGMFLSILQIVIVPIALGLIVKSFLPKLADTATDYLPAVSSLAISFLIAGIIGASRDAILNSSGIILLVVILHNCLGYALGFFIGHLCGMSWKKMVA